MRAYRAAYFYSADVVRNSVAFEQLPDCPSRCDNSVWLPFLVIRGEVSVNYVIASLKKCTIHKLAAGCAFPQR